MGCDGASAFLLGRLARPISEVRTIQCLVSNLVVHILTNPKRKTMKRVFTKHRSLLINMVFSYRMSSLFLSSSALMQEDAFFLSIFFFTKINNEAPARLFHFP